jgi:flagellin
MALVLNTNIMSMTAEQNLNNTQLSMQTALQRLSSGLRINSAKDDAAGLAIATRMSAQIRGMTVASRNASDAISAAQTAEGGLVEVTNDLQRMRELAVQAANGTYTSGAAGDIGQMNQEYGQLSAEISRIIGATTFNGVSVLQQASGVVYQVGANSGQTISVASVSIDAAGWSTSLSTLNTQSDGITAIGVIDSLLNSVNSLRATLGAVQNRFQSTINNLSTSTVNLTAAQSRIMDADYAAETANLSRSNILQQAGTAMVAQANALPQQILTLLR